MQNGVTNLYIHHPGLCLYPGAAFVSLLRDYLDNTNHFSLFRLTAGISSFGIIYSASYAHVLSNL